MFIPDEGPMDETKNPVATPKSDQPAVKPAEPNPQEERLARLEVIAKELLRLNYHRSPVLKEMWEKSQEA